MRENGGGKKFCGILEKKKTNFLLLKMKQPTAPDLYPELPIEDGQNYRLQKITEIEKTLINERDKRKSLYKKYKRGVNITDGVDTKSNFDICCFGRYWNSFSYLTSHTNYSCCMWKFRRSS